MDNAIDVHQLTKSYDGFVAVKDLSFSAVKGEVIGLVGPNGAGKTSTLRALAGIHPPTDGQIRICGFDMRSDPVEAKRRLAFMPDEPRLFDYLTVEEHLQFISRIYRVSGFRAKIDPLLEEFELLDKRSALPAELSRGMKQKLMIACGFIHDPEVLIFDEPESGLDVTAVLVLRNLIRMLAERGKAILYSSHVMEIVEKVCTRVIILHRGRIVANDSVERLRELRSQRSLEQVFSALVLKADPEQTARDIADMAAIRA